MLEWIEPHEPLPDLASRPKPLPTDNDLPSGLVAAGSDLSADRLIEAYSRGIFPWFVDGQPVLWWSPDPRMVLHLDEFSIPRSLRKTLKRIVRERSLQITLNQQFARVIQACAAPRADQEGTWITTDMMNAYLELHRRGLAHSVEVWRRKESGAPDLVGGLYGVSLGRMFFGESMFTQVSDGSKIALVYLVKTLRTHGFRMIDCQQNTAHLARFGARDISRAEFLATVATQIIKPAPDWQTLKEDIQAV